MRKIKFGVRYFFSRRLPWNIDTHRKLLLELEQLGYSSVYLNDHLLRDTLEGWTALSVLGSITRTIRLGHMVLCNSLRNPALLANMAATFDIITKGRLELGIGSGWSKTDYDTCGLPYPRASVRIAQLEEAVQIIKKMWTEENPSFQGKHYWMKDAQCPQPVQTPHPPIMIAGGGEKLLLKVVAKHADICLPNFSALARVADMGKPEGRKSYRTVDECKHKFTVLSKHCEAVGRDVSEIEKMWSLNVFLAKTPKGLEENIDQAQKRFPDFDLATIQKTGILGTPDEAIKRIQEYIDLGVTYFDLSFFDLPQDKTVKLFAKDVMPYFKKVS